MPARTVRTLCPPGFVIGRSVHARDEAIAAAAAGGLDYLLFGTVFPTASKPGREATGTSALAEVVAATAIPVLAVGGVSTDNVGDVAAAGAAGFAAIGMFADGSEAEIWRAVRSSIRSNAVRSTGS
jgi:thiamine-phosphate diphosphorylase